MVVVVVVVVGVVVVVELACARASSQTPHSYFVCLARLS